MPPETLSVFAGNSRLLGKGNYAVLDEKSLRQAHAYVLKNCDEVLEYAREHKRELACNGCVNVEKVHDDSFSTWFERVICAPIVENPTVNENLLHLAYGPDKRVTRYEACIVSGLRFHTKQREVSKRTQNSGVMVKGEEASGLRDYYGVLTDIIKLDYLGNHEVVLFKCDWFEGKSIQKDKYNCVSVNLSRPWKTNEPYVLASQVQQVFYVNDNKLGKDWKVVVETQARSSWSVLENNDNECTVVHELSQQNDDLIEWQRNDIPGTSIAANLVKPAENRVDSFIVDEDDVDEEDCTMFEYEEEEDEEGEGEEEDDEGDEYEDEDGTN
ncbi:Unknown protein [Striga hermonthica]|uniref:DUF4216 domain-containing protein n=1 Tax=Striga hermonthica TaxID=68872 RepID=A0A9N7NE85_STRHE|nr:Unknown protein [Striga hermonthica]